MTQVATQVAQRRSEFEGQVYIRVTFPSRGQWSVGWGGGVQVKVGVDGSEPEHAQLYHFSGGLEQVHSLSLMFLFYKMGIITIPHIR